MKGYASSLSSEDQNRVAQLGFSSSSEDHDESNEEKRGSDASKTEGNTSQTSDRPKSNSGQSICEMKMEEIKANLTEE